MSPTIGKLWAGTLAAGAVVAAGPIAWRAAVGCFFSPSCQLQTINILESAAGASPTPLNPGRLLPVLTETTRAAFLEAALAEGRSGVSAAGRALQSHTSRAGSWLADLAQGGNTAANSKVAKGILEMILERGQTTFGNHPTFGNVIRVRLPDGSGAWWKETGQFIGFLERYTPKQ